MKPKAIIFDMDGTLVDNIVFHKKAWLSFLNKYTIIIKPEDFNAQNHGTIHEMILRFFGNSISEIQIKELGQEKEKTYRELYREHIKEVEGLSHLLEKLKKNRIKIGLATMGDIPNIDFILDTLSIRSYFDCIVGGHEIIKGKPDPEIFNTIALKLNVKNKECVVFEDSIGGVIAAKNASMKVVGITTTETSEALIKNGCFETIAHFNEYDSSWL